MSPGPNRYDGKPMLRLAECYVLRALGQLSEEDARRLELMAPKLGTTLGFEGEWHMIIARALDLPENAPDQIRKNWSGYQEHARQHGNDPSPQRFAELFCDQLFLAPG